MPVNLSNQEIKLLTELIPIEPINDGDKSPKIKLIRKLYRALKKIKVSSAKGKGRNLQKLICEKISKITGFPYNQQDDDCLIHSREMGQAGVDIILRGAAKIMFPFAIECKSTEQLNLVETIKQAKNNTEKGIDWLIVHKRKAIKNPVVIMNWNTFEELQEGDNAFRK